MVKLKTRQNCFFNQRGQVVVEFMLVLPFFLAFVFTTILFLFLIIHSEMITYSTFWGGRSAVVSDESNADQAAASVLPNINFSVDGNDVSGKYKVIPLIASENNNPLNMALASEIELNVNLKMQQFIKESCSEFDDNQVGSGCN